jgi:hypothetical protein
MIDIRFHSGRRLVPGKAQIHRLLQAFANLVAFVLHSSTVPPDTLNLRIACYRMRLNKNILFPSYFDPKFLLAKL